ncbi:MAG: hypothetical protein ACRBB3_07910 [Alphaproteobacteria bacterium]
MKRSFATLLALLMVLPVLLQVMPHDVIHALHKAQDHHITLEDKDHHSHKEHSDDHHAISIDIVTFYDEYLHVDIQSPDNITLSKPTQDIDNAIIATYIHERPTLRNELSGINSRAPPDHRAFTPDSTPIYLSTERLRI